MTRDHINTQNSQYVEYVTDCKNTITELIRSGLIEMGSTKLVEGISARQLIVFNPLSWKRSDVVQLQVPANKTLVVKSNSGELIPTQCSTEGTASFIAKDVPSIGYRTFWIDYEEGDYAVDRGLPREIENDRYHISFDKMGSISNILDKKEGAGLVNQDASKTMNQLMRWTLLEEQPFSTGQVRMRTETGPVFTSLIAERPGTLWPQSEVRLYRDIERIEISNQLDRDLMPFVPQTGLADYYSFLFPVMVLDSQIIRVENISGFHRWPQDYLPGARQDAVVPRHVIAFNGNSDGKQFQINLSVRETFFNHLPAFEIDGNRILHENTVRATVMRKFDQGVTTDFGPVNFPTVEPGLDFSDQYAYSMSSNPGPFDAVAASRLGWETNLPLQTVLLPSGSGAVNPQKSFWELDADNVEILAFKPHENKERGIYILRLQEISGLKTKVEIRTPFKIISADKVSMTERKSLEDLSVNPFVVTIGPNETATIRLHLEYR
jgi:hypothetical protein